MEWRLYDKEGNFLQDVNCQYDSCDIALLMYNAEEIIINFKEKKAKIVKKAN